MHEIVSFNDEPLIVVDAQDNVLKHLDKSVCHQGDGILHRAFSVFIFNTEGKLLIQQRSAQKPLWPEFWANSCCSHPRRGETLEFAVERRLQEELGIMVDVTFLYQFTYHAKYLDVGSERELCSVFVGKSDQVVQANPHEVKAWQFISPTELDHALVKEPNRFTPWLKMEWQSIRTQYWEQIERL